MWLYYVDYGRSFSEKMVRRIAPYDYWLIFGLLLVFHAMMVR